MKRKFFRKILISFIAIAIFLAPISPVLEKQNNNLTAGIQKNTALATVYTDTYGTMLNASTIEWKANDDKNALFDITIATRSTDQTAIENEWEEVDFTTGAIDTYVPKPNSVILTIYDETKTNFITYIEPTALYELKTGEKKILSFTEIINYLFLHDDKSIRQIVFSNQKITNLTPNTKYVARLFFRAESHITGVDGECFEITDPTCRGINLLGSTNEDYWEINPDDYITFQTTETGALVQGDAAGLQAAGGTVTSLQTSGYSLDCTLMKGLDGLIGCIAGITYFFWEISAWIAETAGSFLDFFIYYSTNSDSYTSSFVTEGWRVIRDIANIFFIIALLYIAIKTILSLNVTNNKKLIGAIVLIALLINFSLFFTQVIIDASNILAKVFYNQVDSVDANGAPLPSGGGGQKSISVSLISGFNPQEIVSEDLYLDNRGKFVFITLLLLAITLYTAYMFFVVAVLFVGRVVALWVAMIFAPLAFASYAVPWDLPFNYKKWWPELFQAAFLAPIFIFFLYIIILFTNLTQGAFEYAANSSDFIQQLMKTLIPFAIILVLLMKAKKLAIDYSGDLGKTFSKVGNAALGFAGGAIGGMAAIGLSSTAGKLSSMAAGSEGLKEAAQKKGLGGFAARMALRTADFGSKASFDVRKSPVGGLLAKGGLDLEKGTGALGLAGAQTAGGYKGLVSRKQAALEKTAELYKTKMSDPQVKEWSMKQAALWDAKKTQAKINGTFDEAKFIAENGQRPDYTTASQLNAARMKTFKENIGKTGLVASMASAMSNKVTDKELAEATKELDPSSDTYTQDVTNKLKELQNKKMQRAKLVLGIAGIIATGGVGGIQEITKVGAEKELAKKMEKETKKVGLMQDEVKKLKAREEEFSTLVNKIEGERGIMSYDAYVNDKLAELENTLRSANIEEEALTGEIINIGSKINSMAEGAEKLRFEEQRNNLLEKLGKVQKDFITNLKEKSKYTSAKDAPDKLINVRNKLGSLEKDMAPKPASHAADKGIPKPSGGGHEKEEKHEAPHPPAGGGGGHDSHGGGGKEHH